MPLAPGARACYGAAMTLFAHLTDLHLRPPGTLTLGTVDADRCAEAAIDALIARHPDVDAVLVTGDLTDLGEEEAYARAAMLLSRFTAPVLVMPGNHDRTPALREAFAAFPGGGAELVPGKACHAHRIDGVTVVALDTAVGGRAEGELGAEQLAWLDATLAGAGPALIAMHHPPFACGIGFMDAIGLRDAVDFAQVLARHDNVVRIVCGHVHRTIVGAIGRVPAIAVPGVAHQVLMSLTLDAPPRMVMEPPAYGMHLVVGSHTVSHVGYVDDYATPPGFDRPSGAMGVDAR